MSTETRQSIIHLSGSSGMVVNSVKQSASSGNTLALRGGTRGRHGFDFHIRFAWWGVNNGYLKGGIVRKSRRKRIHMLRVTLKRSVTVNGVFVAASMEEEGGKERGEENED